MGYNKAWNAPVQTTQKNVQTVQGMAPPKTTGPAVRASTGPAPGQPPAKQQVTDYFYTNTDDAGKSAMLAGGASPTAAPRPQQDTELNSYLRNTAMNPYDGSELFGQGAGLIGQGADALSGMLGNYGGSGVSAGNVSGGGMQVGAERVGTQDVLGQMRDDYGLLSGQYGGILGNADPLWQQNVDHQMRRLQEQQEAERNRLGGAMAASGLGGSAIGIGAGIQSEKAYQDTQMQALLDISAQEMQNRLQAGSLYNQAFGQMGGMENTQADRFLQGDISNQQAALEASMANQSDITRRNLADQDAQLRAQIENEANNLMARGQDITGATNLGGLGSSLGSLAAQESDAYARNLDASTGVGSYLWGQDMDAATLGRGDLERNYDITEQQAAQKREDEFLDAALQPGDFSPLDASGNLTPSNLYGQAMSNPEGFKEWVASQGGLDAVFLKWYGGPGAAPDTQAELERIYNS